ncbi:RNA polymerase factor sigma-54 [Acuticoccus kalidii]|uniref:RNA polymerase factor sigma-54 n=1 Tax=Acuticoccus kalidii TaxID=2910977 RepID=UPI0034E1BF8C
MTLSLRLVQSQRQTLAMTPQLMQAIKLLQMSNLELESAVREEVDQNPLLTLASRPDSRGSGRRDTVSRDRSTLDPLAMVAAKPSLADHCAREVASLDFDDAEKAIAAFLIGSVEETGRLAEGAEDDATEMLGVPRAAVEATLAKLQTISPAGLFARSLPECLALQLEDRGVLSSTARGILDNLQLVARRDVRRLAEICETSEDDVIETMALLRTLDPRPGLAFDTTPVHAIEPDVIVHPRPNGGFLVVLDTARLPKVLIDADYHAEIAATGNAQAVSFANQCLRSAHWLTRSLDQRARTIVKVASAIVTRQRAFFEGTAQHVSPLTLREVAEDIGMHESTVSRVVSNKALSSPRGVYPFRAFFAVAIDAADGSVSADAVRAKIRQIVDTETPASVRSDDEIVKTLKAAGIVIARRTVAKYREAMNIPSSVERRRIARHERTGAAQARR